jgi:hypothetical protein
MISSLDSTHGLTANASHANLRHEARLATVARPLAP